MFYRKRTDARKIVILFGAVLFFCLQATTGFAANSPPSAGIVTPSSGFSSANQTVSFTTTYSDPNGYSNIQCVYFLINTAISGSNCFFGYYIRSANKLYLRDNTNSRWLGGYAPGSRGRFIENSYAKLDCSNTRVSGSGKTLSIKWSVVFKNIFSGIKNSYLYVVDNRGASSGWVKKGTWNIDTSPPTGSIKINNDNQYTRTTTVTLNLIAQDNPGGSGLSQMRFSNDFITWSNPEAYATTKPWDITPGEGTKTVYVKFKDAVGNWSVAYSDSIILVSSPYPPNLNTIYKIKDLATQTLAGKKDKNTSIYINEREVVPSNNYDTWLYDYPLTGGTNNLTVTSADTTGKKSQGVSLTINTNTDLDTLDISPPRIIGIQFIPPNMDLRIKIQDPPGVLTYNVYFKNAMTEPSWHLAQGNFATSGTGTTQWTDDGTYTGVPPNQVQMRFYTVEIATVEKIPPTGTILINNGVPFTNSTSVTLNLSAQDNSGGSGLSRMQFSNDNINWSTPEVYAATKSWLLLSGDGQKTVYIKYKDAAGNWSNAVSARIILDTTVPQISSLTPLNNSTFCENDTISISPTVVNNPNSSPLEYQFLIDGAIKQPWSGQSKYDWQGASGIHNLKAEVRDIAGQDAKQVEVCVFKKPPEPPN
jgi:hypothetical protein